MQYSTTQRPNRRSPLSSVLVAAAAIALLLGFAASAQAEDTSSTPVAELAAEIPAPTEAASVPVEVPTPTSTPEPVEAGEAPVDVEPATVGEVVTKVVAKTEPVTASAPNPIKKTASAAVGTVAASVDSVTKEAKSEVDPLGEAGKVLRHGAQGSIAVEPNSSPATAELPSAPAVNPHPQPSGSPHPNQRGALLDQPFMQRITGLGGIEPLRLTIARAGFSAEQAAPAPPDAAATSLLGSAASSPGIAPDRNGDRRPNWPNPTPSPLAPQTGAPGSAPSSFIPIVALLALLALAAPAIRRRPREGPVCSPPAPFVCALERPG
jgi:MYXO-CTERM domain-containing protein